MNIIPGEPVPPGFEDEVNRTAEIQQAIDQYKGNALIGLEYAIELYEEDRREPGYYCVLCDKRGDPRTIMQHWTSFNHRLKYLQKHFPTAVREFNPVKYKPNSHTIMIQIVQGLTEAIEDHYGRLPLTVCNADDFRRLKTKLINEVNAKYHLDERAGPNFLHAIDRTLWENKMQVNKMEQTLQITLKVPKRGANNEKSGDGQKTEELDEISSDDDGHETSKKSKKQEQAPAYRVVPRVRHSPLGGDDENENDKKLPTPKELSLQASHIAQERYKWEKYRCLLEIQLKEMSKSEEEYDKFPERHPLYPEEWKKFWNRRYKELQAEKKTDPNKYDYKPEWVSHWKEICKQLHMAEVEKKKKEIKLKLGLPEDAVEKVEQLKEKYKVQVARPTAGVSGVPSKESGPKYRGREKPAADVIDISDDEAPRLRSRSRSRYPRRSRSASPRKRPVREHRRRSPRRTHARRSRSRSRSRSLSPFSDEMERPHHHHRERVPHRSHHEPDFNSTHATYSRVRFPPAPSAHFPPAPHYRVMDPYHYPKYERSPTPHSKSASVVKEEPEPEDDGPLTVVVVLRLLTALEEHLGSLGPKAVNLLGKALALEKVKANSADELLIDEDNCVFFETIKEKLKGLLIADVIEDQQKVRAVKKAIRNIAAIIHQVNTKGKQAASNEEKTADGAQTSKAKKSTKGVNLNDFPFDRQIVATKLAALLVKEGYEDVSTNEMNKLIWLHILMVQASGDKKQVDGQAMHTKDFIAELGIVVPQIKPTLVAAALAALPAIADELFEKEVSALTQEAEEEVSNDNSDRDSKMDNNSNMLESLTDSDLQTLLQNFKHLSTEEQHHLVAHLKKLETVDPVRVEKLRKFVNIKELEESHTASNSAGGSNKRIPSPTEEFQDSPRPSGSKARSNFDDDDGMRHRGVNVANPNRFSLDDEDEDEDYNYEDVFKAASSNVKLLSEDRSRSSNVDSTRSSRDNSKSKIEPVVPVPSSPNALTFNPAGLKISMSDTQNLIANLMGSLQQSNSNATQSSNSKPIPTTTGKPVPTLTTSHAAPQSGVPYYQQQQQQQNPAGQQQSQAAYAGDYNQNVANIGNQAQGAGYYNNMGGGYNNTAPAGAYNNAAGYNNVAGGYNDPAAGYNNYAGYQQWGNGQQQQQFGMSNFVNPQQPQQMGGYNMYGRGGN